MKRYRALVCSLVMLTGTTFAGDFVAGERRSGLCASCHGSKGMSKDSSVANIACQHEAYLIKALKAYQTGERNDVDMQSIAGTLSDVDIESLATFYSAMTCRVKKPKIDVDG